MCTLKCKEAALTWTGALLGNGEGGELLAHPARRRKRHDQTDAREEVREKNKFSQGLRLRRAEGKSSSCSPVRVDSVYLIGVHRGESLG